MQKRLTLYRGQYCVYWRENGKPVRRSLGTSDRAEALRLLDEFERLSAVRDRPVVTIKAVWAEYQKHLGERPAAITMAHEGKALLPVLGDLTASTLSPDDVRAYAARREAAGRKPGTILTELNRLTAALNHAVEAGILDRAPAVPKPSAPPPKDRYLTRDEAKRLVASAECAHVRLFISLALTTAARVSAILELPWARVDMERRLAYLSPPEPGRRMKGRAVVPLNDSAVAALRDAANVRQTDFVIEWAGAPVKSIKKGVASAARRAGLIGVTPHVLRHTAAVWMAEGGVPMSEISQYLGHSSTAITERVYARFSPDYLRGAAARLELDF